MKGYLDPVPDRRRGNLLPASYNNAPQTLKRAIGVCPAAHSRCLHGAIHRTGGDIDVEMVLAAVA